MLLRVYRVTDRTGLALVKMLALPGDLLVTSAQRLVLVLQRILSGLWQILKLMGQGLMVLVMGVVGGIGSLRARRAAPVAVAPVSSESTPLSPVTVDDAVVSDAAFIAPDLAPTETVMLTAYMGTLQEAPASPVMSLDPTSGIDKIFVPDPSESDSRPARRSNRTNRPRTATVTREKRFDDVDKRLGEDPLKLQNRRLSLAIIGMVVVVIGAVLWATDPNRTSPKPSGLADNAGSSLILGSTPVATADNQNVAAAILPELPTPIPTNAPPPAALRVGGSIAYVVREQGQTDIWAINVGTRTPIRILNNITDERDPAWNSDGSRLAYASKQDGNWELYTVDLNAPDAISRITYDLAFQANPTWSNDSQWLAYETYQGDNLDIYAVPVNGSEAPLRITDHATPDFAPAWAPDGRKIAFVSWRDGNQDVYIFDLDTLETRNLTGTPERNEDNPAWSPDGRAMAFSAVDAGREKIFVQNLESNTPAELIGAGRTPSWSPDGSTLTYSVDADDKSQTYLYAALYGRAGGVSTEVAAVPYGASSPVWTDRPLPPALVNAGGLDLAVRDPLFVEQVQTYNEAAPIRLQSLPDVQAPSAYLSDQVNDSFNALREQVLQSSGIDVLGTLDDAWWNLERLPQPGEERRNWHMTGRAFSITRNAILGFPAPIEIVREDSDTETLWRVYVRVSDQAQSGQLGEPLRKMPWDFTSRSLGDVQAYNQGGRLRAEVPKGYYIDLTQLATDYGWDRRSASTDWRANNNATNYWLFYKPERLDWLTAMLEVHTEGELINFMPTPAPGS